MKSLDKYFELQKEIFKYFGYVEDWKVIPMEDHRNCYWMICGPEDSSSTSVVWSYEPLTAISVKAGKKIFSGNIYTQRFLPKWVYHGKDYTMIAIDTRCDDNKMLMIFDNKKECQIQKLKDIFNDNWSDEAALKRFSETQKK